MVSRSYGPANSMVLTSSPKSLFATDGFQTCYALYYLWGSAGGKETNRSLRYIPEYSMHLDPNTWGQVSNFIQIVPIQDICQEVFVKVKASVVLFPW